MRTPKLALILALAACGGSSKPASSYSTPIEVVPMKLVMEKKAAASGSDPVSIEIEIHADKTITTAGHLIGRYDGTAIVGPRGAAIAKLAADGTIELFGANKKLLLDEKDELVTDEVTVGIRDDGTVFATSSSGKPAPLKAHFEGYRAQGRREGALLIAYAFALKGALERAHAQSSAGP